MAFKYGFYDSLDGDRKYSAKDWSSIFDGIILDGVFLYVDDGLFVEASGTDLSVEVKPGRAWFNHTWTVIEDDANDPFYLDWETDPALQPEPATDRIDAIVIEVNNFPETRANRIFIKKGPTNTNIPTPPTMEQSEYIHQYPLAYVQINHGMSILTQSSITDKRGTDDLCPWVAALTDPIPFSQIRAQWEAAFSEWMSGEELDFESWSEAQRESFAAWKLEETSEFYNWFQNLQNELDEHQAAHLQAEINRDRSVIYVVLDADDWVQDGDVFTQTVTINDSGFELSFDDSDKPLLVSGLDRSTPKTFDEEKAYAKSFGLLSLGDGEVSSEGVTFRVHKKPIDDIRIGLKGK